METSHVAENNVLTKEVSVDNVEQTSSRSSTTIHESDNHDVDEAEKKPVTASPTISDWNGPDDPENPQNWSRRRKWCLTFFLGKSFHD